MSTDREAIRRATPGDLRQVVDTLSAAFAQDPIVRWAVGEGRADRKRLGHFFRAVVGRHALPLGGCDLTEHGAAVWLAPGQLDPSRTALLRQLPDLVRAFGPRLVEAATIEQLMRSHHPEEPHWYLQFLGVVPGRTGQGIGSSLLRHRLAQIDREPAPVYLESSHPANVPLYERHGFEVIEEVRIRPDAPVEFLMWRPARTPGAGQTDTST